MNALPISVTGSAIFVTDFADGGVVVPLCFAVAVTLLLLRRGRVALIWTVMSLAVWGTMLLLKLAGYTIGHVAPEVPGEWGILTASGHAAGAAAAYGALAGLLAGSAATAVARSCLVAAGIALLIGATRVILGDHTPLEVVLGGAVGIAGATVFAGLAREALHGGRRATLLAATAATLFVVYGQHFTLEREISAVSARAVQTFSAP